MKTILIVILLLKINMSLPSPTLLYLLRDHLSILH